jgi:hypothetical protein
MRQENIPTLISGLEFVRAYIENLQIIRQSSWEDHLDKVEQVLIPQYDSQKGV